MEVVFPSWAVGPGGARRYTGPSTAMAGPELPKVRPITGGWAGHKMQLDWEKGGQEAVRGPWES